MGRPRRGGPSGRYHAWLNLCKNNAELRKLIPIYFPQTSSHLTPNTNSLASSDLALLNKANDETVPLPEQVTLKEINNTPAFEPLKPDSGKSDVQSKIDRTYDIDEEETKCLQQLINHSLIHKSLNMSPIHWKCVPQLRGLKEKHLSAICGVIIKRRRRRKVLDTRDKSRTEKLSQISSESEKYVNTPEQPDMESKETLDMGPSIDLPSMQMIDGEEKENQEHQSAKRNITESTTEQTSTRNCRYCDIPFMPIANSLTVCPECHDMLSRFKNEYRNPEYLACLRNIPCHNPQSLQDLDPTDDNWKHLYRQWCSSCKIRQCIKAGFKLKKRKNVTRSFKSINLKVYDDEVFEHRGRERQVKRYLDGLMQDFKTYQLPLIETETSTLKPLDSDLNQNIAYFLDFLWVRPLHLLSHSQLRTEMTHAFSIVDITPPSNLPNCTVSSDLELPKVESNHCPCSDLSELAGTFEIDKSNEINQPDNEYPTGNSCTASDVGPQTELICEYDPIKPMDISSDNMDTDNSCSVCHIMKRCDKPNLLDLLSDDLARKLIQSSSYAITLGPIQINNRESPQMDTAKNQINSSGNGFEIPAEREIIKESEIGDSTRSPNQVEFNDLNSNCTKDLSDSQITLQLPVEMNPETIPTDVPFNADTNIEPASVNENTQDFVTQSPSGDMLKFESNKDSADCKSVDHESILEVKQIPIQEQVPDYSSVSASDFREDNTLANETVAKSSEKSGPTIPEERKNLSSGGQKEVSICGPCLLILRSAIRHIQENFQSYSVDTVTDLFGNPNKYCHRSNQTISITGSSDPIELSSLDQNHSIHTCITIPNSSICQSCLVYECLHLLWNVLGGELSLICGNLFSYRRFTLPVGGPLIVPMTSNLDTIVSLYTCRLPPSENNSPEPYQCTLCHSNWSSLSFYKLNNHGLIVCSGCIWTLKNSYLSVTNSTNIRRIARRLHSAAASTDESLPFLSEASRRFIIDIARLAQLVSDPCVGNCLGSSLSSLTLTSGDTQFTKPKWFLCPPCTTRRCLRLLPVKTPVRPPQWVRRRAKLLAKTKFLEDLDPRLIWPNFEDHSANKSKPAGMNKLRLTDVEFTTSAIQRWLLPPHIATTTALSDEFYSSSSSDEDSSGEFSSSTSGFSTPSSDLTIAAHDSDYGADGWWYGDQAQFIESPITRKSPKSTKSVTESPVKTKVDSDTEPETDKVRAEEFTVNSTSIKRQRRLTAKAAEALAGKRVWRSRRTSSSACSKSKLSSDDDDLLSTKSGTEKTVALSPSVHYTEESKDENPVENQEQKEMTSLTASPNPDRLKLEQPALQNNPDIIDRTENLVPETEESEPTQTPDEPMEESKTTEQTEDEKAEQPPRSTKAQKRKPIEDIPVVKGKRRLKLNHRFLDDFDGDFRSLAGFGRQIRDPSRLSDTSEGSRNSTRTSNSTSANKTNSASSWLLRRQQASQKRARETLNASKRGNMKSATTGHFKSGSGKYDRGFYSRTNASGTSSSHANNGSSGSRLGPRVKQVSRPSIRPEDSKYSSTLNAMVHAARLAAVGAKVPGGASPVHAALAVTSTRTNRSKPESSIFDEADERDFVISQSDLGHRLPDRCGQCPACVGLIQPCGQCQNCRSMEENGPGGRSQPCKRLICFRRRSYLKNSKTGPRVKLPSNFSSPGSATSNDRFTSPTHISRPDRNDNISAEKSGTISLLQTIPNLASQLEQDAWLPLSTTEKQDTRENSVHMRRSKRECADRLHVYSDIAPTPIRGGDLGMHFNSAVQQNDENLEFDRIRPVEGEVIDTKLAHHGGYAVVTTLAAAPPKEICYACGSGGGQLLFCVSCAEPFHFYCVERQFRPRRKDHFICRNCTVCRRCRLPEADLRCVRCSLGYHPDCLTDFPPAKSSQRGTWTCPQCTTCTHCGVKACKVPESSLSASENTTITVPWSNEISKCAACGLAESQGDICPECDRAYLPTTKQMVQCDSCRLWMHRTCLKLTSDEYELIARMPENQLNKFNVCCTVCQKEQKKQLNFRSNSTKPSDNSKMNDNNNDNHNKSEHESNSSEDSESETSHEQSKNGKHPTDTTYLRNLARDTLMERMSNLVKSCRQSGPVDLPLSPQSGSHWNPIEPSQSSGSSSGKSNKNYPTFNISNELARNRTNPSGRFLPQVDGICDSDSGDDFNFPTVSRVSWSNISGAESGYGSHDNRALIEDRNSTYKPKSNRSVDPSYSTTSTGNIHFAISTPEGLVSHTSEHSVRKTTNLVGDYDATNSSTCSRSSLSVSQDPVNNKSYHTTLHVDPDSQSTAYSHSSVDFNMRNHGGRLSRKQSHSPSLIGRSGGPPPCPPVSVPWLVDKESETIWTSPRSLIYRFLIRILVRLSSYPVNSPQALSLRRLLQWLSWITDSYFPWLSITEMASDVRGIMRQANGRADAVFKHFEERSVIELHELICPVIARIHELHTRSPNPNLQSFIHGLSNINSCYLATQQHLKLHHPSPELEQNDCSNPSEVAIAKLLFMHSKRSRCYRPHEIENMEAMRQETRDDRWVEHWSTIEENMVVRNFQQILYKMFQKRCSKSNSNDTLTKIDQELVKCQSTDPSPQQPDQTTPDSISESQDRPKFYLGSNTDDVVSHEDQILPNRSDDAENNRGDQVSNSPTPILSRNSPDHLNHIDPEDNNFIDMNCDGQISTGTCEMKPDPELPKVELTNSPEHVSSSVTLITTSESDNQFKSNFSSSIGLESSVPTQGVLIPDPDHVPDAVSLSEGISETLLIATQSLVKQDEHTDCPKSSFVDEQSSLVCMVPDVNPTQMEQTPSYQQDTPGTIELTTLASPTKNELQSEITDLPVSEQLQCSVSEDLQPPAPTSSVIFSENDPFLSTKASDSVKITNYSSSVRSEIDMSTERSHSVLNSSDKDRAKELKSMDLPASATTASNDQKSTNSALIPTLCEKESKLGQIPNLHDVPECQESKPTSPIPPTESKVDRYYFALEEFWTAPTTNEQNMRSFVPPNLHLVDLDEEDELTHKMAAQAADTKEDVSDEEDNRRCLLCAHHGDNSIEGRLLFTGSDTWVHVNCALWSNEVYEEDSGELIGLSDAIRRGRFSCCADCGRYGATLVCSNAQSFTCPLHSSQSDSDLYNGISHQAVHFACALRRCPPQPRPVFTADRSWFCSPECHEFNANLRISEAIQSLNTRRKRTRSGIGYSDPREEEDFSDDSSARASSISEDALAAIEESVADDLEPIGLGDLLVCRRVFVPSDCFAASLLPESSLMDLPQGFFMGTNEHPFLMQAAHEAVSTLAVSPNSLAFLQCNGLPPSSLVVTIGSLRVDRLGEIREASDSLATSFHTTGENSNCNYRSNFLCPINYRARRIYWSCFKLDARISYTLHVGQTLAASHVNSLPAGDPKSQSSTVQRSTPKPKVQTPTPTTLPISKPLISPVRTALVASSGHINNQSHMAERLVQPVHQLYLIPRPVYAQPITASNVNILDSISVANTSGHLETSNNTMVPVDVLPKLGPIISTGTQLKTPPTPTPTPICIRLSEHVKPASSLKIVNAVSLCPASQACSSGVAQPNLPTSATPIFSFSTVRTVSETPTLNVLSCGTPTLLQNLQGQGSKPKSTIQNILSNQVHHNPVVNSSSTVSLTKRSSLIHPIGSTVTTSTTSILTNSNLNRTLYLNTVSTHPSSNVRMPIPIINKPGGVIRINGTLTGTNRPSSLTTPTKDVQLARQLDGLFHNLPTVHVIPKEKPRTMTQIIRPNPGQPKLLPQLDGTMDDDSGAGDDSDYQSNDRRSSRRRPSSSLSSNSSVSSFSTNRHSSGRSAWNSSKRNPTDSSKSNSIRHNHRPTQDPVCSYVSDSPTSNKRRWIEDRTRQQELANLVSKAKQANHARLYQNEVEKHAQSFRLRFSIDGVVRSSLHPLNAWRAVVSRVITLRQKSGLPPLISLGFDGWSQFGLSHRYIIFLLEQMHGAFHCYRYRFRYHWRRIDRLRQKFTPPIPLVQGCSRAVPWTKPQLGHSHAPDPLSFLHCISNPPPRSMVRSNQCTSNTSAAKNDCHSSDQTNLSPNEPTHLLTPNEQAACREAARQAATLVAQQLKLPLRYREACIARAVVQATGLPLKSSSVLSPDGESSQPKLNPNDSNDSDQENCLEEDLDDADDEDEDMGNVSTQFSRLLSGPLARFLRVSVHPSRIHGRGLFALRSFREDEMVIEYTGELIRNSVCEARELKYRATGLDCYMFRIDQDWVIDATYAGNAARFINHSCEPNCYAKVITIDDKKHIVILAQRRIYPGEELTYDYRFPKESDKLPCNCSSYSCRKYLN